jgi:hypothetical protein
MSMVSIQSSIEQLEDMFKTINSGLYENELRKPKFSIGVLHGNQHSRYVPAVYKNITGMKSDEIMFDRDYLSVENTENIFTEMLRCAVMCYANQKDIKITSRQGHYYNKQFKSICNKHGLNCRKNDSGYSVYSMNDDGRKLVGNNEWAFLLTGETYTYGSLSSKNNHHRKYECPVCRRSCRSTSEFDLSCVQCGVKLKLVKVGVKQVDGLNGKTV